MKIHELRSFIQSANPNDEFVVHLKGQINLGVKVFITVRTPKEVLKHQLNHIEVNGKRIGEPAKFQGF